MTCIRVYVWPAVIASVPGDGAESPSRHWRVVDAIGATQLIWGACVLGLPNEQVHIHPTMTVSKVAVPGAVRNDTYPRFPWRVELMLCTGRTSQTRSAHAARRSVNSASIQSTSATPTGIAEHHLGRANPARRHSRDAILGGRNYMPIGVRGRFGSTVVR